MRKTLFMSGMLILLLRPGVEAQSKLPLTWEQVKERFQTRNPTLLAGKLNIEESKAQEITAYLRPNPSLSIAADQIDPFSGGPPHGPFAYLLTTANFNYLHERQHKRELRLQGLYKSTT